MPSAAIISLPIRPKSTPVDAVSPDLSAHELVRHLARQAMRVEYERMISQQNKAAR